MIEIPSPHTTGYFRSRILAFIEESRHGNSVYWTNKAEKDKGDWLRWANQNQYDPNHGTNTDYLSGDTYPEFYGRRKYSRSY